MLLLIMIMTYEIMSKSFIIINICFLETMYDCGMVTSPTCVNVQREDLVGHYIGEMAVKTQMVLTRAKGATLFVDEAYRHVPPVFTNDFGPEAVETIMSEIEGAACTTSDRPAFIFAGYPADMDRFMGCNPGLDRRVTHRLQFGDYTPKELVQIFQVMCLSSNYMLGSLDTAMLAQKVALFGDLSKENGGFSARLLSATLAALN